MGPFEFRDNDLAINVPRNPKVDEEEQQADLDDQRESFLKLLSEQPPMDQNQIVEVNEEAQAASFRRLGPSTGNTPVDPAGVIRGAAGADAVLTAEDRARIAMAQHAKANAGMTDLNPGASGPKPFGSPGSLGGMAPASGNK